MEQPTKTTGIAPADRELIRAAIARARALPATLSEEESVLKIIRIRKNLDRDLRNRRDPRVISGRAIRKMLTLSITQATIISALGIWRIADRYTTSLGLLDQPVPFLFLFTLLFTLSWLPLLLALLKARRLIRSMPARSDIDTHHELLTYDVAVVKALLKEE